MKDKKIIIDDINVSECKCYNPNIKMDCLLYPLQPDACKNNPNCYYKQLKRKEQECEKAKQNAQDTYELYQALMESFNILQSEKIKLEQECEELKEKINSLVCSENCYKYKQAEKYKQTLAEIKEIAEDFYLDGEYVKVKYLAQEILQKISECEGNNG